MTNSEKFAVISYFLITWALMIWSLIAIETYIVNAKTLEITCKQLNDEVYKCVRN